MVPALSLALFAFGGCASNAHRKQLSTASQVGQSSTSAAPRIVPEDTVPALPQDAPGQSRVLTDYLKNHRLPLVGANVVKSGDQRQIILYGFVATPQGRADAETRVRELVHDPEAKIVDRIIMRPELLTMNNGGSQSASASDITADPNIFSQTANVSSQTAPDETRQYQGQQESKWADLLIAILMVAPIFIP